MAMKKMKYISILRTNASSLDLKYGRNKKLSFR